MHRDVPAPVKDDRRGISGGRDREETLTRTKNRCIWSFRLHASRARVVVVVVVRNKTSHLRETRYGISFPTSPKSMHACRAYRSIARGNIREGNIRNGLSRKIAGFHSRTSLAARIFPRRKFHVVCRCEIMQKLTFRRCSGAYD